VVNALYPGEFQPWQFANVPLNCWKDVEYVRQGMDHLLFVDLKFQSYEEAIANIKRVHFFEYQRSGLFVVAFHSRLKKVKDWITYQMDHRSQIE